MPKTIEIKKIKIIFFLCPANAIKSKIFINSVKEHKAFYSQYKITFVFDNEKGGNIELCRKYNFNFIIASDYKNLQELKDKNIDFLISVGWGYKIPNDVIKRANIASLNTHSSYLPDYKGASVYLHYWANCEKYGGATVHLLTEKFDSGNIIAQEKFFISIKDSYEDILIKASYLTNVLIRESIILVTNGYKGEDKKGGRYFYKLSKYKLFMYRFLNCILRLLYSEKRIYTPYKEI